MSRARIHPSTSKVGDQLLQEKQTAAPKPVTSWLQRQWIWKWTVTFNLCWSLKTITKWQKIWKRMPTSKRCWKLEKPMLLKSFKGQQKNWWRPCHQKFDENYGKASGVPYLVNTRQDYEDNFMQKIKNWQFNPPVYEKDEWSTEIHCSTQQWYYLSNNRDNEARPQCTKKEWPGGGFEQ